MINETAYWIALAHIPKWTYLKINKLIIKFFHENKLQIVDFFELSDDILLKDYELTESDIEDLNNAKNDLPNLAFLSETLLNQGFEIIPITSPDYSNTLKDNMKTSSSPVLLYIKGDKQMLKENSIAIVGSREAKEISLNFTDNIAKIATKEFKVIVSGFAKGVDKQALDSALKYTGRSIIVLPQGVLTFGSGYKTYYKQILDGDVLVLSTFFPKAPWRAELAMARNPIIYGLADEIFVAESSDKGGTWGGAIDGLRKGRKIYVRKSEPDENNANNLLIEKGAIPVDFDGKEIVDEVKAINLFGEETKPIFTTENVLADRIRSILSSGAELTTKELVEKLQIDWTSNKLLNFLKSLDFLESLKLKSPMKFRIKKYENKQIELF